MKEVMNISREPDGTRIFVASYCRIRRLLPAGNITSESDLEQITPEMFMLFLCSFLYLRINCICFIILQM